MRSNAPMSILRWVYSVDCPAAFHYLYNRAAGLGAGRCTPPRLFTKYCRMMQLPGKRQTQPRGVGTCRRCIFWTEIGTIRGHFARNLRLQLYLEPASCQKRMIWLSEKSSLARFRQKQAHGGVFGCKAVLCASVYGVEWVRDPALSAFQTSLRLMSTSQSKS